MTGNTVFYQPPNERPVMSLSPAEMAKLARGEVDEPLPEPTEQEYTPPDTDEAVPAYSSPLPPLTLGDPPPVRERLPFEPTTRGRQPGDTAPRIQHNQSHRIRAAAHMTALGMKVGQMAQSLGISSSRMSTIIAAPGFKQLVQEIQQTVFVNNPQVVFRQMAPAAAQTIYEVMTDGDEKGSTRISAAGEVLDRAYGKAAQPIQHEGSMVKELFRQLDEEKKQRQHGDNIVDAEFKEVDPIDALVGRIYESEKSVQTAKSSRPEGANRLTDGGDEGES